MPILGKIFVYFVLWWLVLFVVLPLGVRRMENPEQGHDAGAPADPQILKKAILTSLIALVIWGSALFVIAHYNLTLAIFER